MIRKHSKDYGGGPTHAIEALTTAGVACTAYEYEHDPAAYSFGEETIKKPGIDPTQAFKILMVCLEPTGEFAVGCVPVRAHPSMKLIVKIAGVKSATVADPAVTQRRTGYVVGGINPLGRTTLHRVFIGSACLGHETVIISGGRRSLSVELSPLDLVELTDTEVADLAQV